MTALEDGLDKISEKNRRKMIARNKERSDLKEKLEASRGDLPKNEDVRKLLFDMAWESGHAHGLHEVEADYYELLELVVLTWIEAIRHSNKK